MSFTFEENDAFELEVARWLCVADVYKPTVGKRFRVKPFMQDPTKWRSQLCKDKSKRGYMQRFSLLGGNVRGWQTKGDAPEFDLLFNLYEVPLRSVLSRMLFRDRFRLHEGDDLDYTGAAPDAEVVERVLKQGYLKVEVKCTFHSHWDKGRADHPTFPVEYATKIGEPSGWI